MSFSSIQIGNARRCGLVVAVLVLTALRVGQVHAADGRQYSLFPRAEAGQRYSMKVNGVLTYRTTTMLGQTLPAKGYGKNTESATVTVRKAVNGDIREMAIGFSKCERESLDPIIQQFQKGPQKAMAPYSNQEVLMEMKQNEETGKDEGEVTAEGHAVAEETLDYVRAAFASTMMPAQPVAVGHKWASENVGFLFSAAWKGRAELQFVRVGKNAAGRDVAVVAVDGRANSTVLNTTYAAIFAGELEVDLLEPIVVSAAMEGTMEIITRDSLGNAGMVCGTDMKFIRQCEVMERAVVAAEEPEPRRVPGRAEPGAPRRPEMPDPRELGDAIGAMQLMPFMGKFEGGGLTVLFDKVNAGRATGTITLGDKQYAATAEVKDGKLTGTFEAAGSTFKFTGTLDGETLKFDSEGNAYTLKKAVTPRADNPLARPAAPNPLQQRPDTPRRPDATERRDTTQPPPE